MRTRSDLTGRPTGRPLDDLTGRQFGRLAVLSRHNNRGEGHSTKWLCSCACGKTRVINGSELRGGKATSCGCFRRAVTAAQSTRHGLSKTTEYGSWVAAKARCFNPKNQEYENYGARGITMCAEWRGNFVAFLAHIGQRPAGLTLDRIDVNGNYEPGNVRWATPTEQARNTRTRFHPEVVEIARQLNALCAAGRSLDSIRVAVRALDVQPGSL